MRGNLLRLVPHDDMLRRAGLAAAGSRRTAAWLGAAPRLLRERAIHMTITAPPDGIEQVVFIEMGTGTDQHGHDLTKASVRAIKDAMEKRELVGADTVVALLRKHFAKHAGARRVLLDGFPRDLAQLVAYERYGLPSLYGNLEPLFNRSSGTLRPGWERWLGAGLSSDWFVPSTAATRSRKSSLISWLLVSARGRHILGV